MMIIIIIITKFKQSEDETTLVTYKQTDKVKKYYIDNHLYRIILDIRVTRIT